jgi:hypothetical protein
MIKHNWVTWKVKILVKTQFNFIGSNVQLVQEFKLFLLPPSSNLRH